MLNFWYDTNHMQGLIWRWLCPHQSSRDIESRMKSETRLKLFTLDPDTQVMTVKQSSAPLFPALAALPNVVPSIVLSSEARFLWNRARCEAVWGEVWQTCSGELQRPGVQSAELCVRERGRAHDECKTGHKHVGWAHLILVGLATRVHAELWWRRCIMMRDVPVSVKNAACSVFRDTALTSIDRKSCYAVTTV